MGQSQQASLKESDMNGWTHSSFQWLGFTCNPLTSAHTYSSVISSLLRLQNVRRKREVVPDIFINVHCNASSNLPWALAQARKIWVSTWIKDALEWLTTSVQAPPYLELYWGSGNKTSSTTFSDFHVTYMLVNRITEFPNSQNFYEGDMCKYRKYCTPVTTCPLSVSYFHFLEHAPLPLTSSLLSPQSITTNVSGYMWEDENVWRFPRGLGTRLTKSSE